MVKRRKRHTIGDKLRILSNVDEMRRNGSSLRNAAEVYDIQPKQYRNWKANYAKLLATKKNKKALHTGRVGLLKHLEEELLTWVLTARDSGIPLSYPILSVKAAELNADFARKSTSARLSIIRRFCQANCLVFRTATHVAQRAIAETEDEALVFIRYMRPILQEPNRRQPFILNIDQTPLTFSMTPKKTLHLQGATTIHNCSMMNSTKRFTAAICILASGEKLKPMFVFKGEPLGRIAVREFPASPHRERAILTCQKKAWFDESIMHKWIDQVLVPYLQEKGDGIAPLLLLDDFKVHKTDAIKARLEGLGVNLYLVPGGCTGLAQPVDVGVGKPLKSRYRKKWLDWVLEKGIEQTFHTEPSREVVTGWALDSWDDFTPEICRNAWRKSGFSYFP